MAFTIFYSWQSDKPNAMNRGFIEDALNKAIKKIGTDITIQEALRDGNVILDKDTQGVSGSPPSADVILEKISNCGIFVPDVTFVSTSEGGRKIPNPNVLIEYGWALKEVTLTRIIMVMNTAFGGPEYLPFDMKHLRHPITYYLEENTPQKSRVDTKNRLVKSLVDAIKTVIESEEFNKTQSVTDSFTATQSTINPSTFLKSGEFFSRIIHFGREEQQICLPEVERLFLRIIPAKQINRIRIAKEALKLIRDGGLEPMGEDVAGRSTDRNKYGAYAYHQEDGQILNMSQLFLSGELWGIDAFSIDKQDQIERRGVKWGFFPSLALENIYVRTFTNYLKFAQETLNLPVPLKMIAGATDVQGYRMAAKFAGYEPFGGSVVNEHIVYETKIIDYEQEPVHILRPFFDYIWEECGLERPDVDRLK